MPEASHSNHVPANSPGSAGVDDGAATGGRALGTRAGGDGVDDPPTQSAISF
jgi:hypothetical protein